MGDICIFAGTSEGRELARFLADFERKVTVCVATEYGEALLQGGGVQAQLGEALLQSSSAQARLGEAAVANEPVVAGEPVVAMPASTVVRTGRLTQTEMETLFLAEHFDLVIDCTHPYAQIVTENIVAACANTQTAYRRVLRQSADAAAFAGVDCVVVPDTAAAVEYLSNTRGNILSTIGAKELSAFANCGYVSRLYARVLPLDASLQACRDANIPPAQIIAMQGPFTYALNKAMIEAYQIKTIVTKDGGKAGGFAEKMQIARDMNLRVVLIQKPEQQEGVSLAQIKATLAAQYACHRAPVVQQMPQVTLVACGVGDAALMTAEANAAIQGADAVVGAARLTAAFASDAQTVCNEINSEKIAEWVAAHPECQRVAVLLTGDIGFYSGATKLYDALAAKGVADCKAICGVSSPVYLCAKLHTTWQDAVLVSVHGRDYNVLSCINANPKVFALLGDTHTVAWLCGLLCQYGMGDVMLCVGENLSYPTETITRGSASELLGQTFAPLSCALILNAQADDTIRFGIEDEAFLRLPKVPMTKAEVRAVSLSKLHLTPDAIAYDVGAGTGSVSIEMALLASRGRVYAIEKNPEARAATMQNKLKFKADNLEIIAGLAPDCMEELPAPTHVFIGGSSGNLAQIVALVLRKNPQARFVLNTVTLETLGEAMALAKQFAEYQVVEIASSQAAAMGRYHLMKANNPIYVITFQNESHSVEAV